MGGPGSGGRRPDGVEPKANEVEAPRAAGFIDEADKGPALERPATRGADLNAALEGRAFPGGLSAIADKGERDRVKVCNLSLKRGFYDEWADENGKLRKKPVRRMRKPFEVFELAVWEARHLMGGQERVGIKKTMPIWVIVGAFEGNCHGKMTFRAHNRTFKTCPYTDCSFSDHGDHKWSVWQAMHFLRTRRNPDTIERFTSQFDLRADVAQLAGAESKARREAFKREQMQATTDVGPSTAVS